MRPSWSYVLLVIAVTAIIACTVTYVVPHISSSI